MKEEMEGERHLSELETMNVALMAKEERVCQLEKELRDARSAIQQVQNRCREVEKEKEMEDSKRASLEFDLDEAQSNIVALERECKLKLDVVDKQRRALESLTAKMENQKESFQNELEDARRRLIESGEREEKFELASQQMGEKERQFKSLRDAHEKLLAVHKAKLAEETNGTREILLELEASQSKCDEQIALIKEQETELRKSRKEVQLLTAQVAAAEADASSKASLLDKMQMELEKTASNEFILSETNSRMEDLRVQVQTLMNKLSDESALRLKAERDLHEYKVREDSLLKIEQASKALEEEAKWRNEQFKSLEEAHDKLKDRLNEGSSEWTSERASILKEVEVLTEELQSRDNANNNLRSQVKRLEQSLAHEENCRKLLEFQLADAKASWESVSAEFEAAQSILESLREKSKSELAFLQDTLAEKDGQLKELNLKQTQIDRDQKELMRLETELDRYKSTCEQLQESIKEGAQQELRALETRLKSEWEVQRQDLMRSLNSAESTVAAKEVEMKELEMEMDRIRSVSELLRASLAESVEKRLEAKREATSTLERVSVSLAAKEQHAMELETELVRLQGVVHDVRECNYEAERRITVLENRLRDTEEELQAKSKLNNSYLSMKVHEEVVLAMRAECEFLQRQVTAYDIEKYEVEKHHEKLRTELQELKQLHPSNKENLGDGGNGRSAIPAGQKPVLRRRVSDSAKQAKVLKDELQNWKDVAEKSTEDLSKLQSSLESVQKEREDLKAELKEWMQKSNELNCVIKDLEADIENWKQSDASRNEESQLRIEEIEHLRAEVERLANSTATAEEEVKAGTRVLLDSQGESEENLNVIPVNPNGHYIEPLEEVGLDCSSQSSGRVSNDWGHAASELETEDWSIGSSEVEDYKRKVALAEKELEESRQNYEILVKELRSEVEAWKKSAQSIAEDGRLEKVELEKKLKDFEAEAGVAADCLAEERKKRLLQLEELQAEIQIWKKKATDAAEEYTSLRDGHAIVIKTLQLELAQSKAATEECQSMRMDLEKVALDLQNQIHMWKQKAEIAIAKSQDYKNSITAMKEELGLLTQHRQDNKALQLQLEHEQLHLKESLTATQNELQKWKDRATAITMSIRTLQDESAPVPEGHEVNVDSFNGFESQLQKWKAEAEQGKLSQLQLRDLLAETQSQLSEWKQKAADLGLTADSVKEELANGRLKNVELLRSNTELEAGLQLWRQKFQEGESKLESLKAAIQKWEEEVAAITQATRSLTKELDLKVEEGRPFVKEISDSMNSLRELILTWKEKVAEGESMQSQLRTTLLNTQTELQEWKDRAIADSRAMKGEIDQISEDSRQQKEKLYNMIHELGTELLDLKSRVQVGASVQLQLETGLSEMEAKAAAATAEAQALKKELDCTIIESSSKIDQLSNANAELLELKVKAEDRHSQQLLQLQNVVTEKGSQLQELLKKAKSASEAENELRVAVEEVRSENEKLQSITEASKAELLEWKEKTEHLEKLRVQLTSSLTSTSEELQSALNAKMGVDLVLRNLATELSVWKEKVEEGAILHEQMKKSLTETQAEIQDLKENVTAFSLSTDSLKDDLHRANELASTLKTELNAQKDSEASLLNLNRQLESDLLLLREEAFSRKQKMTLILTQLEGTSTSQKQLQNNFLLAQRRLLEAEEHRSQAESANLKVDEPAAQDFIIDKLPSTEARLTSQQQRANEEQCQENRGVYRIREL